MRIFRFLAVGILLVIFVGLVGLVPLTARAASSDDFVITIKTDNPGSSTSTQFTIPTIASGYNYNVDCNNDGINEATGRNGDYTCSYGVAGTYTIRIKDNNAGNDGQGFPRIYFAGGGDAQKLMTVAQWGFMKWTSMAGAFYGCSNLTLTATDTPDLSNVTDMSQMFLGALAFNGNIGNWNTSAVTDMTAMFAYATAFNQNLSSWNTAAVTGMSSMFYDASAFNQNIGSWNTANVTNMSSMFEGATAFNQNLGGWNVSSLTSAGNMFSGVTLSRNNYDALLTGWDAQALHSGVFFHGGNSKYCAGETARNHMVASDGWTITDGGKDCPTSTPTKTPTATATATETATATPTRTPVVVDVKITKKVTLVSATQHKYKLIVKNQAAGAALGLTITDKLPKNYTISKYSSATASCAKSGRTVTCTLGQLDPTLTTTIIILAAPNGATGKNCATVTTTGTTDGNTLNNKACVTVPLAKAASTPRFIAVLRQWLATALFTGSPTRISMR